MLLTFQVMRKACFCCIQFTTIQSKDTPFQIWCCHIGDWILLHPPLYVRWRCWFVSGRLHWQHSLNAIAVTQISSNRSVCLARSKTYIQNQGQQQWTETYFTIDWQTGRTVNSYLAIILLARSTDLVLSNLVYAKAQNTCRFLLF